jgi:hypothetical protein
VACGKGGPRPTLLTINFSGHFDLDVSAKTCRGFFGAEKMRDGKIKTGSGSALFFRLAKTTQETAP